MADSLMGTIDADFEKAQVLKEFPFDNMSDPAIGVKWIEVTKNN